MTKLYISEYEGLASTVDGVVRIPQTPPVATQVVDYSGGEAKSNAFGPTTNYVELHNDSICSIAFGANPTASVTSPRLAANERVIYGVNAGQKVSAITNT